ncbi:hypothetical protein OAA09_01075 [bacterium]|nr:hypothetical protein [bacterium]
MPVGQLVVAKEDKRRGILCTGLVLKASGSGEDASCYVVWGSESTPRGWWFAYQLEAIDEDG